MRNARTDSRSQEPISFERGLGGRQLGQCRFAQRFEQLACFGQLIGFDATALSGRLTGEVTYYDAKTNDALLFRLQDGCRRAAQKYTIEAMSERFARGVCDALDASGAAERGA